MNILTVHAGRGNIRYFLVFDITEELAEALCISCVKRQTTAGFRNPAVQFFVL